MDKAGGPAIEHYLDSSGRLGEALGVGPWRGFDREETVRVVVVLIEEFPQMTEGRLHDRRIGRWQD